MQHNDGQIDLLFDFIENFVKEKVMPKPNACQSNIASKDGAKFMNIIQ